MIIYNLMSASATDVCTPYMNAVIARQPSLKANESFDIVNIVHFPLFKETTEDITSKLPKIDRADITMVATSQANDVRGRRASIIH